MHTCAVVVPIYQSLTSPAERLSLQQTLDTLTDRPVYVVGPHKLEPYFNQLRVEFHSRIRYKTYADQFFMGVKGYNNLLLSRCFYQAFDEYEYMLIVQTDALVLSNALEEWCAKQYSYVGAPWFDGYTTPTRPLRLSNVGNGGFSLRRIPDFLKVLSRPRVFKNVLMENWPGSLLSTVYRYIKDYHSLVYGDVHLNVEVNEDLFWGLFVPRQCSFFHVPTPLEAMSFAFEAHPDHLYELNQKRLPFGVHAWQRYMPDFWLKVLAEQHPTLHQRLQSLS